MDHRHRTKKPDRSAKPRKDGDGPIHGSLKSQQHWQAPHKWAVGTTFEWEFDFPVTTNPAYEAKPAPKRKTRTSANPKAVSSRDRKTSKPATVQTAKPKAS